MNLLETAEDQRSISFHQLLNECNLNVFRTLDVFYLLQVGEVLLNLYKA